MTTSLDFAAVAPLGFVCAGAFAALSISGLLSRRTLADGSMSKWDSHLILADARIGTTLAFVCIASLSFAIYTALQAFAGGAHVGFDPARELLLLDPLSTFAIALLGVEVLLCVLLSIAYLPAVHVHYGGYYGLLMISSAGMIVVVTAVDLVVLFVGIEVMTIPLYILVGIAHWRAKSIEAALKLVLTSMFASAILLYGIALLYGATGETGYEGVRSGLEAGSALGLGGIALVLVGLGFKVSAFPFHAWTADVLHGAPTIVASVVSVAVRTAAIVMLIRFLGLVGVDPLHGIASGPRVRLLLSVMAAGTMLVGSLMALVQTNVKRMLAHAGVAHAGMLLLGLACATEEARAAVLFYLVSYAFMSLGVFAVLVAMSQGGRDCESFEVFAGLGGRHPVLAAAMCLFLLALAGIPGTAGFMARFQLFLSAVNAGQIELVLVAAFSSVILLVCYLRIPTAMYMRARSARGAIEPASGELLVLAVCAAAVLYLGVVPGSDPFGAGFDLIDGVRRAAAYGR